VLRRHAAVAAAFVQPRTMGILLLGALVASLGVALLFAGR